jgi:hypothetical protein
MALGLLICPLYGGATNGVRRETAEWLRETQKMRCKRPVMALRPGSLPILAAAGACRTGPEVLQHSERVGAERQPRRRLSEPVGVLTGHRVRAHGHKISPISY